MYCILSGLLLICRFCKLLVWESRNDVWIISVARVSTLRQSWREYIIIGSGSVACNLESNNLAVVSII